MGSTTSSDWLVGMGLKRFIGQALRGIGNKHCWMLILYKDPCVYCGGKSNSKEHVIPWSKGGKGPEYNIFNNQVGACKRCNVSRGNTPFLIWWGLKTGFLKKVKQ